MLIEDHSSPIAVNDSPHDLEQAVDHRLLSDFVPVEEVDAALHSEKTVTAAAASDLGKNEEDKE